MEKNYSKNLDIPLHKYVKNIHSQYGEDGILEEVLRRIESHGNLDGWCVEFGAWDGLYLSNTYNLIKNSGYKAVLIEGDKKRYLELCKNIPQSEVIKICKFVTFDGDSTLDAILRETPIPKHFDLLSIDIDGCDYFIFESLNEFKPKIICIEYNPTIPNEVEFIQPKSFKVKQGASALAVTNLAKSKGYQLVAVTKTNLIFIHQDFRDAVIGSIELSLNDLRDDSEIKMFLFSGYDGTILSNKKKVIAGWHGTGVYVSEMQALPRFLRTYSGDYSFIQSIMVKVWQGIFAVKYFINEPEKFREKFKKLIS
jgi:hypothetical protein